MPPPETTTLSIRFAQGKVAKSRKRANRELKPNAILWNRRSIKSKAEAHRGRATRPVLLEQLTRVEIRRHPRASEYAVFEVLRSQIICSFEADRILFDREVKRWFGI